MDQKAVQSIASQISREFSEFKGVSPKVQKQDDRYLLIFESKVKTADGFSMNRTLRVVASADGKILKKSTSR